MLHPTDPSTMMPSHFPPWGPSQLPQGQDHTSQHQFANAMTLSKRVVGEDDDEIQFISEKPVKRRRMSTKQPGIPKLQQALVPSAEAANTTASALVPYLPVTAMQMSGSCFRNTDRRLSTGMVGLPSDLHAIELSYALRGVSMPVLEKFTFDQPFRKPRPSSPPELSPKQLPSTISPAMLNIQSCRPISGKVGFAAPRRSSAVYPGSGHSAHQAQRPAVTSDQSKTSPVTNSTYTPETAVNLEPRNTSIAPGHGKMVGSKATAMFPLPSPHVRTSPPTPHTENSSRLSENHPHHANPAHPQKQPCQACYRLRQQAQISRPRGLPIVKPVLPSRFVPQLHYHPPYGQHLHTQMIAMPTGPIHQFPSNFAPVVMPANVSPFTSPASHPRSKPSSQSQPPSQQVAPQQQKRADKDAEVISEQPRKSKSPAASQPKNATIQASPTRGPIKPPASLIQPTYRKPSPNLIVDVAESCQEKFPFEDVAKRHNVPVDKVFDVFAAIIQVPLLRCPTDRRRPGKLATARIKQYNKAKKDIQDSRAAQGEGGGEGKGNGPDGGRVDPANIAQELGQVEFPEGFTLGEKA